MALVVEDGTGKSDADAYVDVDFVDEYAEKYGKPFWAAIALEDREVLVRKATQFADNVYLNDYAPLHPAQRLAVPSSNLYVRGTKTVSVPVQIKEAVAELACIAHTLDLVTVQSDRLVLQRTVKAGDVSKSETYSNSTYQKVFHPVEMMLRSLDNGIASYGGGFSQSKMRRA